MPGDTPHYFTLSYIGERVITDFFKLKKKESAIKFIAPRDRLVTDRESIKIKAEARARRILGPQVAFNARISPVLMKNSAPQEVETAVKEAIDQGAPLHNYSIDTVGLTEGVPDENVRIARKTAMEYGKLD